MVQGAAAQGQPETRWGARARSCGGSREDVRWSLRRHGRDAFFTPTRLKANRRVTGLRRTLPTVEPLPEGPMAAVILLLSLALALYLLAAVWWPEKF